MRNNETPVSWLTRFGATVLVAGVAVSASAQESVYPGAVVGLPRQESGSPTLQARTTVVAPTDVNADGVVDLVAGVLVGDASLPSFAVQVALGQGDGTFVLGPISSTIETHGWATTVTFGDLDGDGVDEVVFGLRDNVGALFETLVVVSFDASGTPTVIDRPALIGPIEASQVLLGDVTNDGHADLIAFRRLVVSGASSVFVLAGLGDGMFGASVEVVSTGLRESIGLGDFDEDGALDLVMTDGVAGQVEIHAGLGDGTFAAPSLQPVEGASDVEIFDADDDGHVDIVVASTTKQRLTSLLGDGNGLFPSALVSASSTGGDLARGDLDGDGDDELFLFGPDLTDTHIIVYEPLFVPGTFSYSTAMAAPKWGRKQVFVTHLDGDTSPDLVVAGWAPTLFSQALGGVDIALGGDGVLARLSGFVDAPLASLPPLFANLLIADLNGDGRDDLVQYVADSPSDRLHFFVSTGPKLSEVTSLFVEPELVGMGLADFTDVTGDAIADLIVFARGTSTIRVYPGLGGLEFASPVDSLAAGAGLVKVLLTDFDGDGLPDAQARSVDGRVLTFRNIGGGQFALFDIEPGPYLDIALGDLSANGVDSLRLRGNIVSGATDVCVRRSLAGFAFDFEFCSAVADASARYLVVDDVDNSGTADAILTGATGPASSLVQVLAGSGLSFTPLATTSVLVRADWLQAADENGDGLVDLIVSTTQPVPGANDDLGRLGVVRSLGAGSFELQSESFVRSTGLTVGDVNGDGAVDVATQETDGVRLLIHDAPHPWASIGGGLATADGVPQLRGQGLPEEGASIAIELSGALPGVGPFLVIGFADVLAPLKGGVLVPSPDLLIQLPPTGASGTLDLASTWTAFPSGLELYIQAWQVADSNVAASTGLVVTSR